MSYLALHELESGIVEPSVTIRDQMAELSHDTARRRAEKRRDTKPQTSDQLMRPLGAAQFKQTPKEGQVNILTAKSNRLKGRTQVVGSTAFAFDTNGVCRHEVRRAVAVTDFATLCRLHGVEKVDPTAVEAPAAPIREVAAKPAATVSSETAPPVDASEPDAHDDTDTTTGSSDSSKKTRRKAKSGDVE